MRKSLILNLFLFILFISLCLQGYSQTGGIPTGSDTSCNAGNSLYQKILSGSKDDYGYAMVVTSDSGQVIVGTTNSIGGGGYDGLVMKMNKRGAVVWSKVLGGVNDEDFTDVRMTSDGGYIVCGTTRSYGNAAGEAWLVKLDGSGNVQWSKKYGDGSVEGGLGRHAIQLSDGGYALTAIYKWSGGSGGIAQSHIIRTDAQGNVMWSKQYGVGSASDNATGILEEGNFLVVVGYYNGGVSFMDGYVMKIDKTNGAIQWIRSYDAESRSTWFGSITKTTTGYQVHGSITDNFGSTNEQTAIWNLNTDGTVQNVRKTVVPGIQTISYGLQAFADGGFAVANSENNNGSDVVLTKVNAAGSIVWSKKYQRAGRQQIYPLNLSNEGGYVLAGMNNNAGTTVDSTNIFVMKVDSLGGGGTCSGINTTDLTVVSPSFTSSAITATIGDVTINNPVVTTNSVNFDPVTATLCFYCYIKPTGTQRTVTENGKDHILRAYPNPVVNGEVNISIDAKYEDVAIISVVDIYGNTLRMLSPKEIIAGQNIIKLDRAYRLRSNSNYFIVVKFKNYSDFIKIYVIR